MGAVFAIGSFGALATSAHCLGYCPDRPGYRYDGCTVYMDDNVDIVDVACGYTQIRNDIAE